MELSLSEQIKIILGRKNMTLANLADLTNQSRQNLSNKIKRSNFTQEEMLTISKALNCTYISKIIMNEDLND